MTKYFVVLQQIGEGCDYTIGCGIDYKVIDAENEFEVYKELDEWYSFSHTPMKHIYITECKNISDMLSPNFSKDIDDYNKYLELKKKFKDED